MSGHSKWSTIKRQKGAADAKRSNLFTKLANAITVAARGGADPSMNFQLRLAIDRAKASNMPSANIDRAIARAAGSAGATVEENLYEAYGPGGVAILVEVATDNKNRAIAEIKAVLNKLGGKLASSGAVQYLFDKKGEVVISAGEKQADEVEMDIIDAGAENYAGEEGEYFVETAPTELAVVKKALEEKSYKIIDAKFVWQPKQTAVLDEQTSEKVMKLLSALDDLDDVTGVASNSD